MGRLGMMVNIIMANIMNTMMVVIMMISSILMIMLRMSIPRTEMMIIMMRVVIVMMQTAVGITSCAHGHIMIVSVCPDHISKVVKYNSGCHT